MNLGQPTIDLHFKHDLAKSVEDVFWRLILLKSPRSRTNIPTPLNHSSCANKQESVHDLSRVCSFVSGQLQHQRQTFLEFALCQQLSKSCTCVNSKMHYGLLLQGQQQGQFAHLLVNRKRYAFQKEAGQSLNFLPLD